MVKLHRDIWEALSVRVLCMLRLPVTHQLRFHFCRSKWGPANSTGSSKWWLSSGLQALLSSASLSFWFLLGVVPFSRHRWLQSITATHCIKKQEIRTWKRNTGSHTVLNDRNETTAPLRSARFFILDLLFVTVLWTSVSIIRHTFCIHNRTCWSCYHEPEAGAFGGEEKELDDQ